MPLFALVALLQVLPPPPDTTLFPPRESVMRLYTDCDEARWPWGTEERFVPKTADELVSGVARRRGLEAEWRRYYEGRAGDSLPPTGFDAWAWPLAAPGRLLDNFANPRAGELHEALDIFVAEGTPVRSPVNGVVVAAGDGWQGRWVRRRGLVVEGGGLSRRAGNGVMVFDPAHGGYFLFSHLRDGVLVRAGDVVRRGQAVGRVGHTGNAAAPGRGRHLHFAYKEAGTECGVDGVLINVDPYPLLRPARQRFLAAGH